MALATASGIPLRGHTAAAHSVAFSSDDRWLATISDDSTARLWEVDCVPARCRRIPRTQR